LPAWLPNIATPAAARTALCCLTLVEVACMPDLPFLGRVALVTGGSRGIGRACVERLARLGADIAINYHSQAAAAQETADAVRQLGRRALALQADVSDAAQVEQLLAQITADLGPIDLLVNNAGVFDYAPHTELTPAVWQRTLDVNLTGAFQVTWGVKDSMIARRFGRIVNIASISALQPRPMSIAYAASKAGLVAFTRSIAAAFAPHNIRVNAVAPGLIETEIIDGVSQTAIDTIVANTPVGRIGQPDEVAGTVQFLLSEDSSFTTGQTLVVCGGRVMVP